MMLRLLHFLLISLLVGCHRGAALENASSDAAADTGPFEGDMRSPSDSGIVRPTIEEIEGIVRTMHPDRIPRTPEDNGVISFVDQHLDQLKSPFPRPRMFLIGKRAGHSWVVTVLDLEHLRNGGAGADISVHVSEKQGKFAVDEITLGGY
jgi:hypothetical protein